MTLVKGKPGKKVHLWIKDLLLKVSNGQDTPKCEWLVNGEKIEANDKHYKHKSGRNTFELSIPCFKRQLKGKYECVVTTVEEPILSTAVEVIVDSGKCARRYNCAWNWYGIIMIYECNFP